mgnify:CR=1 FL=1
MRRASFAFAGSALLLLLLLTSLVSCGRGPIGQGVVLWSPDEEVVPTGASVPVYEESQINETYTVGVQADGQEQEVELPQWRVFFSRDEDEVSQFAAEFASVSRLFARAERNALPVRSEKSNHPSVPISYRLREGEVIKILERDDEPTDLSGLVARWHRILTEGGIEGWAFGYYLNVYDLDDGALTEERDPNADDPLGQAIVSGVWRPGSFEEMLDEGRIDLEIFQPAYGLFPNPEEKRFDLVLPGLTRTFEYESIIGGGFRRYVAEGTSLQFEVPNPTQMSIQFTHEGRQRSFFLVRMDADIAALAAAEQERRREAYLALRGESGVLESSAYGVIDLTENQVFEWEGFNRLVPQFIPAAADSSGTVRLPYHLAPSLQGSYDGVVSFDFDGTRTDELVSFLYTDSGDGVRLVFVPPSLLDENVVTSEPASPLVMFFSRQ